MVKPETSNGLPPDEIVQRIEKALKHGGDTHTWDDIRQGLIDGHFQIHWNNGGVAVTQLHIYPRKKTLHWFLAAGDMQAVLDLQPTVRQFARENGCTALTLTGRRGWERVLPDHGWRHTHSVLMFDLEGNA